MSDTEIFIQDNEEKKSVEEKPIDKVNNDEKPSEVKPIDKVNNEEKPKKKKRVVSEEQRKRLLANLAKGRAKSLETRRKNRLLKKAQKKEQEDEKDALLAKTFLNKDEEENKRLKKELDEMREKLKNQTVKEMPEPVVQEVKEIKQRPPTPIPEPKPQVTHTDGKDPFKKENHYTPSKPIPIPKPKKVFKNPLSIWNI